MKRRLQFGSSPALMRTFQKRRKSFFLSLTVSKRIFTRVHYRLARGALLFGAGKAISLGRLKDLAAALY